ncbi:unnamed protein product [Calicophoron daubneyi]|uniref:DH domain-containing protein n=1 Tax=Calicophoron daubneyi TaxID=300641 RepID=A0AAV2TX22_CALDB
MHGTRTQSKFENNINGATNYSSRLVFSASPERPPSKQIQYSKAPYRHPPPFRSHQHPTSLEAKKPPAGVNKFRSKTSSVPETYTRSWVRELEMSKTPSTGQYYQGSRKVPGAVVTLPGAHSHRSKASLRGEIYHSYSDLRRLTSRQSRHAKQLSAENLNNLPDARQHRHGKRSISPIHKTPQWFREKNLDATQNSCSVRIMDDAFITLQTTDDETLGERLKLQVKKIAKPVECIDLSTNMLVPWNTKLCLLNQKILQIREISGFSSNKGNSYTGTLRKLERKNPPNSNSQKALCEWLSFFTARDQDSVSVADRWERMCFEEALAPDDSLSYSHGSCVSEPRKGYLSTSDTNTEPNSKAETKSWTAPVRNAEAGDRKLEDTDSYEYRRRVLKIEKTWEQLINPKLALSTKEQKKQSAIWEVFLTEASYIAYIRTILDVYFTVFTQVKNHLFPELSPIIIFNNLQDIYRANLRLWLRHFYKTLCEVRRRGELMRATILEPGMMQIPRLFPPYTEYCADLPRCRHYIKRAVAKNLAFSTFLQWADSQCRDHREPLWDQMAKPFKRVVQYRLMLENIRKYCQDRDELDSIDKMHARISSFVSAIDKSMDRMENRGRIECLADELIFPEVNESPGDEYQYFYDNYHRESLLDGIALPPPVILTSAEVEPLTLSLAAAAGKLGTTSVSSDVTKPHRGNLLAASWDEAATKYIGRTSRLNSLEEEGAFSYSGSENFGRGSEDFFTSLSRGCSDPVNVTLTKWVSPQSSDSKSQIMTSFLDRVRTDQLAHHAHRTAQRMLIHHGKLRMREPKEKGWNDATCFLFTDQFLITKSVKRGTQERYEVTRPPIRLDKLALHKINERGVFDCAALDDFSMVIQLYTFWDAGANDVWCKNISQAKDEYIRMMTPEILIATPLILRNTQVPISHPKEFESWPHLTVRSPKIALSTSSTWANQSRQPTKDSRNNSYGQYSFASADDLGNTTFSYNSARIPQSSRDEKSLQHAGAVVMTIRGDKPEIRSPRSELTFFNGCDKIHTYQEPHIIDLAENSPPTPPNVRTITIHKASSSDTLTDQVPTLQEPPLGHLNSYPEQPLSEREMYRIVDYISRGEDPPDIKPYGSMYSPQSPTESSDFPHLTKLQTLNLTSKSNEGGFDPNKQMQ